jgi:uridylate kinase
MATLRVAFVQGRPRFGRTDDYQQVIEQRLRVMDMTAFALCQENHMPIMVLNFWAQNALVDAVKGNLEVGTLIS